MAGEIGGNVCPGWWMTGGMGPITWVPGPGVPGPGVRTPPGCRIGPCGPVGPVGPTGVRPARTRAVVTNLGDVAGSAPGETAFAFCSATALRIPLPPARTADAVFVARIRRKAAPRAGAGSAL